MSSEDKSEVKPLRLIDVLKPYEEIIIHMEEVLLLKRPLPLALLLICVLAIFAFISSSNAGFFAVVALVFVVAYGVCIIWAYLKNILLKHLFKPLPEETDKNASNRVRSLEELCEIWEGFVEKVNNQEKNTSENKKRLIIAGISFALAALYYFVDAIWLNLALTIIAILLPGILLHPEVNKFISKGNLKKPENIIKKAVEDVKDIEKPKDIVEKVADEVKEVAPEATKEILDGVAQEIKPEEVNQNVAEEIKDSQ